MAEVVSRSSNYTSFIKVETLEVRGDLQDPLVEGCFHQQNVAGLREIGLEYQPRPQARASSQWLRHASADTSVIESWTNGVHL